jgi:cell division protein FtsQ
MRAGGNPMSAITSTRPDLDEDDTGGPARPARRRRWIAIAVAAVVVLGGVGVWLVAFSSVFGVGSVTVRGSQLLSAKQVRAAAHITAGTPLVRLDSDAVRRRVQRLPDVAAASVVTSFPSSVTITVTDRTPVAYVRSGHREELVDRTGKRYRAVAHAPRDLPRLVLPNGKATTVTDRAAASVAAALPTSLLADTVSIQALTAQSITVVLDHGRVVQWGSATRNADKARVLPVLLRRNDTQIDVTDPDQPFTR